MEILDEIEGLGYKLERFHGIFYQLWAVSSFYVSDKIPTCGVRWNKKWNMTEFIINPKFWNSLDDNLKLFILCHEMLHLVLRHPQRSKGLDKDVANIAQDVCINEMLVESFGFDKKSIKKSLERSFSKLGLGSDKAQGCWLDTVKFNTSPILPNQSFEYYYHRIDKKEKMPTLIDMHVIWGDGDSEKIDNAIKGIIDAIVGEEITDLQKRTGLEAGKTHMNNVVAVKNNRTTDMRWKNLFTRWIKPIDEDVDRWTRKNRRFNTLKDSTFILPSEVEDPEKPQKGDIFLFLDTSGSCTELAQDFYNKANSIPRKWFDVKLFGFDCNVYAIEKDKLLGFGGTSFRAIESYLQKHYKNSYPSAVFVITDGYGDKVQPQYPDRWYWFLSERNSTSCIPPGSLVYDLNTLEKIK